METVKEGGGGISHIGSGETGVDRGDRAQRRPLVECGGCQALQPGERAELGGCEMSLHCVVEVELSSGEYEPCVGVCGPNLDTLA